MVDAVERNGIRFQWIYCTEAQLGLNTVFWTAIMVAPGKILGYKLVYKPMADFIYYAKVPFDYFYR